MLINRETAMRYYQEGLLDKALNTYEKILEEEPKAADLLHAIAILKAQQGHYECALTYINNALKEAPSHAIIHNNKGNILVHLNKLNAAQESYQKAINYNPDYATAYNGLGKCLYKQNKFTEAQHCFEKALTLKPDYIEAHYNHALVLIKKEKWTDAIAELEPIIDSHPDFTAALGQLGELYLQIGDYQKALRALDRRAELEPEHVEANHSLAQALMLTNHIEEAILFYEKTLMLSPNHPEANHNLANSYMMLGDIEKALNYFLRQLEITPLPETYYNIGVILLSQERNQEAIQYLEEAKKWQPDYLPIYLNLGGIYLKQQLYEEAISAYQTALLLDPDNKEIQYIIQALSEGETPERAPNDYLRNLFNQYAHYYDAHLTRYLNYQVPTQLARLLRDTLNSTQETWKIVDLGCGTGLSGEAFKNYAAELIGIDISEHMIESAKKKAIYSQLIIGDIEEKLKEIDSVDLLIAADVFAYLGNLNTIFERSYEALNVTGRLLFSVEKSTQDTPYQLQKNMRYTHTKKYIESLAKQNNFIVECCENAVLRQQQKEPVEGYLFLLKK